MTSDDCPENLDDVVFRYTDENAVADGILVPFLANGRDTRHRITRNAFDELAEYHRAHGCADYDDARFLNFFFSELLPLLPAALDTYRHAGILMTDYTFRVIPDRDAQTLWYLPNENSGVTIMLPSDY